MISRKTSLSIVEQSDKAKILTRKLDRAERVAGDNPRQSRAQAVQDAERKATNYVANRSGAAASSATSVGSTIFKKAADEFESGPSYQPQPSGEL